jgi:signal transduction histidine kinase
MVRLIRPSRLALRLLFVLIGAALALSFASIDMAVANAIGDRRPLVLHWSLIVAVVVAPPTLIGILPQVRQVEGVAAMSLLRLNFAGQPPGPARTWPQRWRSAAWFWAHLAAGAVAGFTVIAAGILCVRLLDGRYGAPAGAPVVGTVAIVVGASAVVLGCGEALARLAPALLGPSTAERLAELEARTAHLYERTRLARELHDGVGNALNVVVLQAAAARRRLRTGQDDVAAALSTMQRVAGGALEDLDDVLALLRHEDDARRVRAHDLRSLQSLVEASRQGGQSVALESSLEDPGSVPGVVSREAYRIVQEGLTNALRHAPDQPVRVVVARTGPALRVQVTNSLPAGPDAGARRGGRGLVGLRERVRHLGGTAHAGSQGDVWRVDVTLPAPTGKRG